MPTTDSTWRKILVLATYVGVESNLDRQWSCRYGGYSDKKLDAKLITLENNRLIEDKLDLRKVDSHSEKENNKSITETEKSSLANESIAFNKGEKIQPSVKPRENPVDAPIGSSLRHFILKSDARYAARRMFHAVMPRISAQPSSKIGLFPQIFKIPFLQKNHILVLRTASREQAEYLFNKALKFNPVELLRPPSYAGGGADAAIIAGAAGSTAATTAAVVAAC